MQVGDIVVCTEPSFSNFLKKDCLYIVIAQWEMSFVPLVRVAVLPTLHIIDGGYFTSHFKLIDNAQEVTHD